MCSVFSCAWQKEKCFAKRSVPEGDICNILQENTDLNRILNLNLNLGSAIFSFFEVQPYPGVTSTVLKLTICIGQKL